MNLVQISYICATVYNMSRNIQGIQIFIDFVFCLLPSQTLYICDRAWENRAYVHTKFDHIFEFQTSITLLIKLVI